MDIYRIYIKVFMDILLSLSSLFLLSPVILIVSILIKLKLGSPVLFTQQRPGYKEKLFTLYKFRTMTNQRDTEGKLLPDETRLTKFGRFLRSTSLDELPELFNVLKGEMSFVGPRPLLQEYLPLYSKEQRRRHEVKPGITGWAQINGRNNINWKNKFELDIWYVKHISFILDIKILWLTFWKVIRREGIAQEGRATMEKFTGTEG